MGIEITDTASTKASLSGLHASLWLFLDAPSSCINASQPRSGVVGLHEKTRAS